MTVWVEVSTTLTLPELKYRVSPSGSEKKFRRS